MMDHYSRDLYELHDTIVQLVPAYAIGAADQQEASAVEAHMKVCAECRGLAEEYRGLSDGLLFAAPLAPAPVGLGEDLRRRINTTAPQGGRRMGWLDFLRKPGFALGVVAVALLVLTNVYWAGRVGKLENQASDIAALAQAPGIRLRAADAPGNDYRASDQNGVVYVQPGSKIALLCVYAFPQLEKSKTYQAWLVRDGQRVSAGTFKVNQDGYGILLIDAGQPVNSYQQLGITVEPAGGSPAPTTPRVIGGEL